MRYICFITILLLIFSKITFAEYSTFEAETGISSFTGLKSGNRLFRYDNQFELRLYPAKYIGIGATANFNLFHTDIKNSVSAYAFSGYGGKIYIRYPLKVADIYYFTGIHKSEHDRLTMYTTGIGVHGKLKKMIIGIRSELYIRKVPEYYCTALYLGFRI